MYKKFFLSCCLMHILMFGECSNNLPIKIRQPIKDFTQRDLTICSFGASVTQQKDNIWDHFVSELNKKTGRNHKHIKMGYGGDHLYSASICFIDDVISLRPDICILDWFDTGWHAVSDVTKNCLETLIRKLLEIKSYIILFYHTHVHYLDKPRIEFIDFVDHIGSQYNITSYYEHDAISLLEPPSARENILRDNVHTTPYGSEILGKIFCNYFSLIPIQQDQEVADTPLLPSKNGFYNIAKVKITEENISGDFTIDHDGFYVLGKGTYLILNIQGTAVGLCMKKGPYSPIITITIDNQKKYTYSIWDAYCNFERTSIGIVDYANPYIYKVTTNMKLEMSDENPNYSESKKSFNYSGIEKKLKIKDLYIAYF